MTGMEPLLAASLIGSGGMIASSAIGASQGGKKVEIPGTDWRQTVDPQFMDLIRRWGEQVGSMNPQQMAEQYAQPVDWQTAQPDPRMYDAIGQLLNNQANPNNQYLTGAGQAFTNLANEQGANIYDPNTTAGRAWQENVKATEAVTQKAIDENMARQNERFMLSGTQYGSPAAQAMGDVARQAIENMANALSQRASSTQLTYDQLANQNRIAGAQGQLGVGSTMAQNALYSAMNRASDLNTAANLMGRNQQTEQAGYDRQREEALRQQGVDLTLRTQTPIQILQALIGAGQGTALQPGTPNTTAYTPSPYGSISNSIGQILSQLFGSGILNSGGANPNQGYYGGGYGGYPSGGDYWTRNYGNMDWGTPNTFNPPQGQWF